MKKSQLSFFFIVGLVVVIILGLSSIFLVQHNVSQYTQETQSAFSFTDVRVDVNTYINQCVKQSATDAIQDTGIREDTKLQYASIVKSKIYECVTPLLNALREQAYQVTDADIKITVGLNPDTIIIDINYPLFIQKNNQKFSFDNFHYTFDRSTNVYIPGGVTDREITIVAPNGKATLKIPKGVKITDENGNPVENIGMKVDDVHFDNLENSYVLGQIVYASSPDGAQFSQPIEISIEFRKNDLPAGYTTDNIKMGWWNNDTGIWYATDASIQNNIATAKIYHFSSHAIVLGKQYGDTSQPNDNSAGQNLVTGMLIQSPAQNVNPASSISETLFMHRYSPFNAQGNLHNPFWFISGGAKDIDTGAAYLIDSSTNNKLVDCRKLVTTGGTYITLPKVTYGFFPNYYDQNFNLVDESTFTSCEPNGEQFDAKSNMYYGINSNGPYFKVTQCMAGSSYVCSNEPCPMDTVTDKDTCEGKSYCQTTGSGDNDLCIPYDSTSKTLLYKPSQQQNNPGLPCCHVKKDDSVMQEEKVFGWFNYRCAGGTARPQNDKATDETGVSSLLAFQPGGNAVVAVSMKKINGKLVEVPNIQVKTPANLNDLNGFKKDAQAHPNDPNFNKIKDISYFCDILPFPNDGGIIHPVSLTDSGKQTAEKSIKGLTWIYYKLNGGKDKIAAYGIYGANLAKIKKGVDLSAVCEIDWSYWGEGAIKNHDNTDEEQNCQLGKLPN